MQIVVLSGLHCEACIKLATKKLLTISGVSSISNGTSFGEFIVETAKDLTEYDINQVLSGTDYSLVSIQ